MNIRFLTGCILALIATAAAPACAQPPSVSFRNDGAAILENSLVKIVAANRPGPDNGLTSLVFKPTGFEMIDVLYGQTDYVTGHALGERWDATEVRGYPGGAPRTGTLYAPLHAGAAIDQSAARLVQVTQDQYRLQRSLTMRRDLATLEASFELTNVGADPTGFALRIHSALSPGARGKYQSRRENIWLPTEAGVVELDQSISIDKYFEKYKGDKFFLPIWKSEPGRSWVRGGLPTPPLAGNWSAQVNRENGDGCVYIVEPETLVGFYNSPGTTFEPVLRATALERGATWRTRIYLASFSGAKDRKISGANPLFIITQPIAVAGGELRGEVIPLFKGTVRVLDAAGKTVQDQPASPDTAMPLRASAGAGNWTLEAVDSAGVRLGRVEADGRCTLSDPGFQTPTIAKPPVSGNTFTTPNFAEFTSAFLRDRDLVVHADWNATPEVKKAAKRIAQRLNAGVVWTKPEGGKVLAVGTPAENAIVREAGLLKNSIDKSWPGPGVAALLGYTNFEATQQPLLIVGGSDEGGCLAAVAEFERRIPNEVKQSTGFDFWVSSPSTRVYPYTRPAAAGVPDKISIEAARGEYEPAQLVVTAYEDLKGVDVAAGPLVNATTGEAIDWKFTTSFQRRNGPLWLRWVYNFPIEPENGWTGHPDALLERPVSNIEAGRSQGIWLTAIVAENAPPGLYRSSITLTANNRKQSIPLELKVWDFTVPRQGLMGDPYMTIGNFAPDDRRQLSDRQVRALIQDLVEHGMRIIHLGPADCFRWHFDPKAQYKGKELDWLEVSDDGQVALDTSQFDHLVETCDESAKPYVLRYMLYNTTLLDTGYSDFRKAFPNRYAGKPERTGSTTQSYYVQEMYQLFRRHLERRGWLKRFVVKIGDEPRGFDYWYNGSTMAAREAGLPIMTAFNNIDWAEAEKAVDKIALWQPLYMLHNPEFFQKAKAAGTLVSWYNCGPPPRIAMGASAAEIRAYAWQAAKADLDALSWWGIQCWPGNNTEVWRNRYSHWDSVMYPAHPKFPPWMKPGKSWVDQSPIDGIRYELIREGLEDARYVNLLRTLIAQAKAKGRAVEASKAEGTLNSIWRDVFPTLNDYRPPYTTVMESRRQVATAIMDLQTVLGIKMPKPKVKTPKPAGPNTPATSAPAPAPPTEKADLPAADEPPQVEPPVELPRTAQPAGEQ